MSEVKSLAVPRPELSQGDLSDELTRTYHFADGSTYVISEPKILYTRPGGTTHRVLDAKGIVHCVAFPGPSGSTVVSWVPRISSDPVKF